MMIDKDSQMTKQPLSKLDKLKQQHEKLRARIQKIESLEKNRESKKDTRRKILVGSYYLDQTNKEGTFDHLKEKMATFLTRDSDRILFDLPLLEAENT